MLWRRTSPTLLGDSSYERPSNASQQDLCDRCQSLPRSEIGARIRDPSRVAAPAVVVRLPHTRTSPSDSQNAGTTGDL